MEGTYERITEGESLPPSNIVLATPSDRFIAALIDGIVISLIFAILPAIGAFIGLAYALMRDALPFFQGRSLGKKMMNIRVIKEDTNKSITGDYGTSTVRSLSLCIPIFNVVDAFLVLSSDRKRFGDKWAKTIVVKENELYG